MERNNVMALKRFLIVGVFSTIGSVGAGAQERNTGNPSVSESTQGNQVLQAAAQFLSLYFNELDCENVGYIQTGEADDHFAPIFLSSDTDSSRTLSRSEVVNNPFAKNKQLLALSFQQMDMDHSGAVSPDELRDYLSHSVQQVDSDRNGDVYPAELKYARQHGEKKPKGQSAKVVTNRRETLPPWERHAKAQQDKHHKNAGHKHGANERKESKQEESKHEESKHESHKHEAQKEPITAQPVEPSAAQD
jgi:hypothetical protein